MRNNVHCISDRCRNSYYVKSRMVEHLSTALLIASTVAMMYAVTHYHRKAYNIHYVAEEKPTQEAIYIEEDDAMIYGKYGFKYRRGYKNEKYCRYEVVTTDYEDVTARLRSLGEELKTDDRDIQIFLLNHLNEEQVLKTLENGELIWELY